MSEPIQLNAEISGPNREAVEAALCEFMTEQFSAEPRRAVLLPSGGPTRGGELIEWVSLALSVPGALLAVLDLADRLKLKQRIQRLLDEIRSAGREGDGGVVLKIEGLPAIDLTQASAADVLNALGSTRSK